MSKKIIFSGQSLFNKVVECTGDVDNAFEMLIKNGIYDITADSVVGMELNVTKITNLSVVNYFTENKKPSTNLDKKSITKQNYEFCYGFAINF